MTERLIVNVDGASRGNPGPAAIGVIIKDEDNHVIAKIADKIGYSTNNQAEYRALIAGLKKAITLGAKQIIVNSDSELMVKQLSGLYRVKKAELKPLNEEVRMLAGSLSGFKISYVPREQNWEADGLANKALDE